MEENYSGVRGEIQLVQDSESNHVMITGAIKGLSPGFHGIYVHTGTTCFDRVSHGMLILFSRKFSNKKLILMNIILDYAEEFRREEFLQERIRQHYNISF